MVRNRRLLLLSALIIPFSFAPVYAATALDLNQENIATVQALVASPLAVNGVHLQETSRTVDFNRTVHVRVNQTYQNYPVWGAQAIIHIPNGKQTKAGLMNILAEAKKNKGSMDGTVYSNIASDLQNTPAYVFSNGQAEKAIRQAVTNYQTKINAKPAIKDEKSTLIVYVDAQNKAHWAYKVNFYADPVNSTERPAKPAYILDAQTLEVYAEWDDIKTQASASDGGGFGGNPKMGKVVYDGLHDHLAKLSISRNGSSCALKNDEVSVLEYSSHKVPTFPCEARVQEHNNVFWDDAFHSVNGGYSPDNDALFGGSVIKGMYQDWYHVPVLVRDGKPMLLEMVVHAHMDNAYWDGDRMTFGDGISMFYPLTSLGVAAHEVSHGFTEQHSNLNYYGQSGGLNESFSDMAAQAAEFYAYKKNSWQIGPEIFKASNQALRYMDQPSKDCKGRKPGSWCSIDDASQYYSGLDVHYSSGVYNHFFYILGTFKNWDTKKAFDVMVHANMNYWSSNVTFVQAACGTLKATKDLGYEQADVKAAFSAVHIDTSSCKA